MIHCAIIKISYDVQSMHNYSYIGIRVHVFNFLCV